MKFKKGDIAIQINCPKYIQFCCITGYLTKEPPIYFHKHYINKRLEIQGTVGEAFLRKPTEEELIELKLTIAL